MSFLFSESKGSKKANIVRIITMLGYFIIAFGTSFVLQWGITAVDGFFDIFATSEPSLILIIILSLIPFPFAPAYLVSLSTVPNQVPPLLLLSTLIGFALFILLTWGIFRIAQRALHSAISTEIKVEEVKKTEVEVELKPVSPITAYIRKDLVSTTRDIQSFMFIFFPIFYPLILILTLQAPIIGEITSIEGILILWSIILAVYLFIPPMLVAGFLNLEESGSSIVASLPVIPRQQAKAKILLMMAIQGFSLILISVILTLILGSPIVILLLLVTLPIAWTFILFMFELKVKLFGKMKYKYVIEELNKENKVGKWIVMILSEIALYMGILIMGSTIISTLGITIGLIVMGIIGVIGLSILIFGFTRMFPKVEKMPFYKTGGLLRNIPILGAVILTVLYFGFWLLSQFAGALVLLPFVGFITIDNYIAFLFVDFLFQFGFLAMLWLFVVPKGMKLPEMSDSFKDYTKKIHLSTTKPLFRNILIGISSFEIYGALVLGGAILLGNSVPPESVLTGFGWFLFIFMLIPGI
jgi:predicted permease